MPRDRDTGGQDFAFRVLGAGGEILASEGMRWLTRKGIGWLENLFAGDVNTTPQRPPFSLQSLGSAYWGEEGYYYFQDLAFRWFVFDPYQGWLLIQAPLGNVYNKHDFYQGSDGHVYIFTPEGWYLAY